MIANEVQKLENENMMLKKQIEAMQELYNGKAGLPKKCEYCKNFIQHYIRHGAEYAPTRDGHCTAGNRIKNRKTEDTSKSFMQMVVGKNYI